MDLFYNLINKMTYLLNGSFFLLKVLYIYLSENFLFFFSNDNKKYILNITRRLSNTNILFVKLFQALALNNNLFDSELNDYFIKFTDNSPYSFEDIDLELIYKLMLDENVLFDEKKLLPFKSGMISLVFRGIYKNKQIVVKLKRKNILSKLNSALHNLFFLIDFLSFIPYFYFFINEYKINSLIQKNIEIIKDQINFEKEVENMSKMNKNCNALNYIKIPEVYKYITNKYQDVIIMEFIEGKTIYEIKQEDYNVYAKLLLKFGFITSIIHGFSHGDLHSGNILFLKEPKIMNRIPLSNLDLKEDFNYKLGILDFGIMFQIKESFKNKIFEITCDIFQDPPEESALKILESGLIIQPLSIIQKLPGNSKKPLLNILIYTIKECLNKKNTINQLQIYKFIRLLYSNLNDFSISSFNLYLSDDFIKIQLVIAMVHGITMKLCKENFIELADNVIKEIFHTNLLLEPDEFLENSE